MKNSAKIEFSVYPPAVTAFNSHLVDEISVTVLDAQTGETLAGPMKLQVNVSNRAAPLHFCADVPLEDGQKTRGVLLQCYCEATGDTNARPSVPLEVSIEAGAETPGIADASVKEDRRFFLPHPGRVQVNSGKAAPKPAAPGLPPGDGFIDVSHVLAFIPGGKGKAAEIARKAVAGFPSTGVQVVVPDGRVAGQMTALELRPAAGTKNDLELVCAIRVVVPPSHRKDSFPGVERVEIETTKTGGKVKKAVLYIRSPAAARVPGVSPLARELMHV